MNFEQIASSFERVYRYSAGEDDYNGIRGDEPLGFELPTGDGSFLHAHTPRKVAAMWLEDQGRPEEAEKVQWHDGPLLLHQGKVKKGVPSKRPVLAAYHRATQHIASHDPEWESGTLIDPNWDDQDIEVPSGHTLIDHFLTGNPDGDDREIVPDHHLPNRLADLISADRDNDYIDFTRRRTTAHQITPHVDWSSLPMARAGVPHAGSLNNVLDGDEFDAGDAARAVVAAEKLADHHQEWADQLVGAGEEEHHPEVVEHEGHAHGYRQAAQALRDYWQNANKLSAAAHEHLDRLLHQLRNTPAAELHPDEQ